MSEPVYWSLLETFLLILVILYSYIFDKECLCLIVSSSLSVICSALEVLVNFSYSGQVIINTQNVLSILACANFLQLQVIKEACCSFLKDRYALTTSNISLFILVFKNYKALHWHVLSSFPFTI